MTTDSTPLRLRSSTTTTTTGNTSTRCRSWSRTSFRKISVLGPDRSVEEGDQVTFDATFVDPGNGDSHAYLWEVISENGQSVPDGTESTFCFRSGQ